MTQYFLRHWLLTGFETTIFVRFSVKCVSEIGKNSNRIGSHFGRGLNCSNFGKLESVKNNFLNFTLSKHA